MARLLFVGLITALFIAAIATPTSAWEGCTSCYEHGTYTYTPYAHYYEDYTYGRYDWDRYQHHYNKPSIRAFTHYQHPVAYNYYPGPMYRHGPFYGPGLLW